MKRSLSATSVGLIATNSQAVDLNGAGNAPPSENENLAQLESTTNMQLS